MVIPRFRVQSRRGIVQLRLDHVVANVIPVEGLRPNPLEPVRTHGTAHFIKHSATKYNFYYEVFSKLRRPKMASKAWITRRELPKFLKVIIWVTGTSDYASSYKLLIARITYLWEHSGPQFTFMYLKEAMRLVVRALAGCPETNTFNKILVRRDSSGIPTIIPLNLRRLLQKSE